MDDRFAHTVWIGGSPCSGKSTIADRLAVSFGLGVYRCDDEFERHRTLVTPDRHPVFARLATASCDEIWMRPVARQIAEELELYREEFPLVLADLATLSTSMPDRAPTPLVVEGAALLPELVAGLDPDPHRVVWIVPTEAFQREHYARRPWRHDVLSECTDPDGAWRNWMARDAGFARFVAADATRRGYRVIEIDGSRSLDETYALVTQHFGWATPSTRQLGD